MMLSERAYVQLSEYKLRSGCESFSVAVVKSTSEDDEPVTVVGVDWEGLFLTCRVDAKTAQRIRDYVGLEG